MRGLAYRRHHDIRMKVTAVRVLRIWGAWPQPVGRLASTHCVPCSCWMCKFHKDVSPRRERAAMAEEMEAV